MKRFTRRYRSPKTEEQKKITIRSPNGHSKIECHLSDNQIFPLDPSRL